MVQKRLSIHGQSPLNRFFLSHLTLLFSIQSTFCERRLIIHLKYFLQIYPPKIWWIQKSSTFAPAAQPHRGFHGTYSSFCRWLTLKYWRMKRKKAAPGIESRLLNIVVSMMIRRIIYSLISQWPPNVEEPTRSILF